MLFTAGRFYNRALVEMEDQPELAYLDLVNCGEVISNEQTVPDNDLFDPDLKKVFTDIEKGLAEGPRITRMIQDRLFQVRRRFSFAIRQLLDDYFFSHHEANEQFLSLKADSIEDALKAAYDLRSRYVHTGIQFGAWVKPLIGNEIQLGEPVLNDSELKKLLVKAPNLSGLERIMRYALLKVSREGGAIIDDLFNDNVANELPASTREIHNKSQDVES